uniref:Uncharacterized protein n=1 Tax=Oryza sativa subsp. japonica TaxID=39947 RepID=Q75GQ9_ORYSJ|nr:hypothetical protein [Oryza sativa Japonica Group]
MAAEERFVAGVGEGATVARLTRSARGTSGNSRRPQDMAGSSRRTCDT